MKNIRHTSVIVSAAIGVGVLIGAANSSSASTSIGASFVGRNATPADVLAPSESAGVVAQTNWNNIFDDGSTFKGASLPLVDSGGNFTAVQIVYDCSDSWSSDGNTSTPDEKLMKGIIKANPNPDTAPINNTDRMLFTITNLPAGSYNVFIYLIENGTGAEADVNIPGLSTYEVEETNVFQGYLKATSTTGGDYQPGNYVEYDAVAPDASGTIQVTVAKNIVNPQVNDGVGCAGIQVVQVSGGALPPNTETCGITNNPSSTNIIAGVTATFSVSATGPHSTQWQKNDVDIPGGTGDSYTTPLATVADDGSKFRARVYNNVNTTNSAEATLNVHINTTPVVITSDPASTLVIEGQTATFTVGYSGPLAHVQWQKNNADITGATNASYTTPATVVADNGTTFRAIVSNNVNTNTSASATLNVDAALPPTLTQGFLKVERWENIGGATGLAGIADLETNIPGSGVAGTTPTTTFYAAGPDVPQSNPNISNFGCRVWGWVKPDITGDYDFFTRSDDPSQVFLNATPVTGTTNSIPDVHTATQICEEDGCCNAFQEPGKAQTTAAPIHLIAGNYYGFVALYKEGGGGDFVQVAWRLSTDTTKAASLKPIPAGNVYTLASPAGQRVSLTSQPQAQTAVEGRSASFTVGVSTFPASAPYAVQWLTNGAPVPGQTGTKFTIPNVTLGLSGTQVKAQVYTLGGLTNTAVVTLTVIPDTFPPAPSAAAMTKSDGTVEVGVSFDEPVNIATLVQGNFSITGGTITSFKVATNSFLTYGAVVLGATGLTPGNAYTVNVKNVADVKGNAIPAAGTNVSFKLGGFSWANSGTPIAPGQVVQVGDNGFDILNGGRQEWASYDEITFAYVKKTNDFDVKVQVVYAEPGSEWTRVGLMARNALNVGEPADDRNSTSSTASAYAQTHVNPNQTLWSSGEWDPSVVPGADTNTVSNPNPNNGHEQNQRLTMGGATSSWGSGVGGVPNYPDVWLRLQRSGSTLHGYRSEDGSTWTDQGTTSLTDQQPDMYVGAFLAVETGNIWSSADFDVWNSPFDPRYDRLFLAQFRNFGDTVSSVGQLGSLSISHTGANVTISWTGAGTLQKTATLGTGVSWADVPGVTGTSYTTAASGITSYYRLRQ